MKRRKRTPPRRRNVYAALVRRYGHRIEASAKAYKRRPKHRTPRQPHDGGFDLGGGGLGPPSPANPIDDLAVCRVVRDAVPDRRARQGPLSSSF